MVEAIDGERTQRNVELVVTRRLDVSRWAGFDGAKAPAQVADSVIGQRSPRFR